MRKTSWPQIPCFRGFVLLNGCLECYTAHSHFTIWALHLLYFMWHSIYGEEYPDCKRVGGGVVVWEDVSGKSTVFLLLNHIQSPRRIASFQSSLWQSTLSMTCPACIDRGSSSLALPLLAGRTVLPPSPKPPSRSPHHPSISSFLRDPTDIYSTFVQNRKRPLWAIGLSLISAWIVKLSLLFFFFFSSLLGKQITPPILGANDWTQLTLPFSQLQHNFQQNRSHHPIL